MQVMKIAIATSVKELPASDLALAAALSQRGCDVRPVIWSANTEDWSEFDAIVVRSCWDYHLRVPEFLTWVKLLGALERDGVAVLNTVPLIGWNADKTYLAQLRAAGICMPDTVFVSSGEKVDLGHICRSRGWRSAVVKPTISASAYRTERATDGIVDGPVLIQEYMTAIESAGEWSLVYFDHRYSHAVLKRARAGDFRVQSAFGGSVSVMKPPAALLDFSETVLAQLPWQAAFARIDLIADTDSIQLMEIEVIEPDLFLHLAPGSSDRLALVVIDNVMRTVSKPLPYSARKSG